MKWDVPIPRKFLWLALLVCFVSEAGLTQAGSGGEIETPGTLSMQELGPAPVNVIAAPALKWAYGGCFSSWCQTGWYSSPAVADINGDGKPEVLWGSYDLAAVSGTDGQLVWRASSSNRVWPGVVVADLTGDGSNEIIVGRSGGQVTVYSASGSVVDGRRSAPADSLGGRRRYRS
jgi:hypothetical protein